MPACPDGACVAGAGDACLARSNDWPDLCRLCDPGNPRFHPTYVAIARGEWVQPPDPPPDDEPAVEPAPAAMMAAPPRPCCGQPDPAEFFGDARPPEPLP